MSTIPTDQWGDLLYSPAPGVTNVSFFGPNAQYGTNTRWARLWADWVYHYPPAYQTQEPPNAFLTNGQGLQTLNPAAMNASYVQAMDNNIAWSVANGHPVILATYRFPLWANNSVGASDQDTNNPYDRTSQSNFNNHTNPAPWNSYFLRSPTDFSSSSAWLSWITYLCTRYNPYTPMATPYGPAWIWGIEVVNEPNYQMWPQMQPSQTSDPWALGSPLIYCTVAQMLAAARSITRYYGNYPVIMGPATADFDGATSRLQTAYDYFTDGVVSQVASAGMWSSGPDPYLIWTHHNYNDIEKYISDSQNGQFYPRVSKAIEIMQSPSGQGSQSAWLGFPGTTAAASQLWLTEGAARLSSISRLYFNSESLEGTNRPVFELYQAELLQACYAAMSSPTVLPWTNVGMLTQFLTYSYYGDFSNGVLIGSTNTGGLLEAPPPEAYSPGQARPAYSTWASFANPLN